MKSKKSVSYQGHDSSLYAWNLCAGFPKRRKILPALLFCSLISGTTIVAAIPVDGLSYDSKIINFQQTITGTVSDELGPLPGATVQVKGTSVGVTTDFDGNYSIEADSDAILVVSYLGYATKEVAINGQQTLNVQLQPDATQLEDVVVVGYGTTAKKDVTGAISSVKAEEIENLPVANVEKALQGRMSGVQVVNNGGAPGGETKIRIRGTGTVNNSDPL